MGDFPECFDVEPPARPGVRRPPRPKPARGAERFRGEPGYDFGDWNAAVRELADYDPDRYGVIADRPLREVLLAWVAAKRRDAREQYRHDLQVWAALAPYQEKQENKKPPKPPDILDTPR